MGKGKEEEVQEAENSFEAQLIVQMQSFLERISAFDQKNIDNLIQCLRI